MDDGPWKHSSSSSGSSSSSNVGSCDEGDEWQPPAPLLKAEPKGRPRKYPEHVRTKGERRRWDAGMMPMAADSSGQGPVAADSGGPVAAQADSLSLVLRPVGGPLQSLVAKVVHNFAPGTDVGEDLTKIVDLYLGPMRAHNLGMSTFAMSSVLAIPPRDLQRRLLVGAEAVFVGSRALAASIISKLHVLQVNKKIRIEAVLTNILYDETPMIVRHGEKPEHIKAGASTGTAATSKLLCVELELGILQRDLDSGKLNFMVCSLPCPVQALQKGTGAIVKHALQKVCRVPLLDELRNTLRPSSHRDSFLERPFSVDMSCCDRAGENRVAEDALYLDSAAHIERLRMPCFVHIGSTSTGRGLSSVALDMTGMIATSLTMDAAGAVASFRQCCVDTLVESMLPPIDAPRYGPDHESVIYLRDLLHLCIPFSDQGTKRANKLMSMLTSDIRELVIKIRILGGTANVDVKT